MHIFLSKENFGKCVDIFQNVDIYRKNEDICGKSGHFLDLRTFLESGIKLSSDLFLGLMLK